MSITIGWWVIPMLVTVFALLAAYFNLEPPSSGYGMGSVFNSLIISAAAIISLIVWLIFAVLT